MADHNGCVSLKLSSLFSCLHQNIVGSDRLADCPESSLLAQEIASVPAEERVKILEEVHGVHNSAVVESEELIAESLDKLAQALTKLRKKPAYDKAVFLAPQYVTNRKFRLMFLRAECFDCGRAAKRLVKYFEQKQFLWGEDKLVKDITLEDFSEDDMKCFLDGSLQIIPSDSVGRPIIFTSIRHIQHCKSYENHYRVSWYTFMNILRNNDNAQRKGIVNITYHLESPPPEAIPSLTDCVMNPHIIRDAIPFRIAALHYCFDSPMVQNIVSVFRLAMGKEWRMRFCPHYGSHIECQHSIMTYGVAAESLPVDSSGNLKLDTFHEYVNMRRSIESRRKLRVLVAANSPAYFLPPLKNQSSQIYYGDNNADADADDMGIRASENDVLIGRGVPFQNFPGNIRMTQLVEQYFSMYQQASQSHGGTIKATQGGTSSTCHLKQQKGKISETTKSDIILEVINQIKAQGGRFLKRISISSSAAAAAAASGGNGDAANHASEFWTVSTEADAIAKVSTCFRLRRRKLKMNAIEQNECDYGQQEEELVIDDGQLPSIRSSQQQLSINEKNHKRFRSK